MEKENVIKYFLNNIFEAESAYYAWKASAFVEDEKEKERVDKIRNIHPDFFTISTRALLIMWIVLICHIDDKRKDNISLDMINKNSYKIFFENNKDVIERIKRIRNKLFAHKSINEDKDIKIPPLEELDNFFKNLEVYYNKLNKEIRNSTADFGNAYEYDKKLNHLYSNIERGEKVRIDKIKKEYGIEL